MQWTMHNAWRLMALVPLCAMLTGTGQAQVLVDKNKGTHNETKKGYMDGNLVGTVYYNFGEVADWQNEPVRSGVWPKGTNHTYVDGVAMIVQAEEMCIRDRNTISSMSLPAPTPSRRRPWGMPP